MRVFKSYNFKSEEKNVFFAFIEYSYRKNKMACFELLSRSMKDFVHISMYIYDVKRHYFNIIIYQHNAHKNSAATKKFKIRLLSQAFSRPNA